MRRMYSLDMLRLVLAYYIALFHVGINISPGATVCVEMFFIISGFFLGRKFYKTKETAYTQWDYTLDHAKALYPYYFFSIAVFFFYVTARSLAHFILDPSLSKIYDIFLCLYDQIPDILFLQSSHHFHPSLNYPLWQISALIISGYFVFGLLRSNERFARSMIFPAAILMARSIINTGIPSDQNFGPIYMSLLYAFSNLCIGVLAYYFTTTNYYKHFSEQTVLFNVLSILAFVSIFAFGEHDIMHLLMTPLVIFGCMDEHSWINKLLNRYCFRHFGFFSYLIYLNHAIIQRFCYAFLFTRLERLGIFLPDIAKAGVYVVLVTVYSLICIPIVKSLLKLTRKKIAFSSK